MPHETGHKTPAMKAPAKKAAARAPRYSDMTDRERKAFLKKRAATNAAKKAASAPPKKAAKKAAAKGAMKHQGGVSQLGKSTIKQLRAIGYIEKAK